MTMCWQIQVILLGAILLTHRVLANTEPGSIIFPMRVTPMSLCYSDLVTAVYPSAWYACAESNEVLCLWWEI